MKTIARNSGSEELYPEITEFEEEVERITVLSLAINVLNFLKTSDLMNRIRKVNST